MKANVRTPAEVIRLVLEEEGMFNAERTAEMCAERLATALRAVSKPGAEVVIRLSGNTLEWGTVHTKGATP